MDKDGETMKIRIHSALWLHSFFKEKAVRISEITVDYCRSKSVQADRRVIIVHYQPDSRRGDRWQVSYEFDMCLVFNIDSGKG